MWWSLILIDVIYFVICFSSFSMKSYKWINANFYGLIAQPHTAFMCLRVPVQLLPSFRLSLLSIVFIIIYFLQFFSRSFRQRVRWTVLFFRFPPFSARLRRSIESWELPRWRSIMWMCPGRQECVTFGKWKMFYDETRTKVVKKFVH